MTFPIFRVSESGQRETTRALGWVTQTTYGQKDWIGDGWLGFLKTNATLIAGRWHRQGDLWEFAPDNSDDLHTIRARPDWEVLDGYWGERAEIVLDHTCRWEKVPVQPRDAIRLQGASGAWLKPVTDTDEGSPKLARAFPDAGAAAEGDTNAAGVVKAGWDHEHCAICWETLGPSGQPEAYVSNQRIWVCERCYVDFVEQRSLRFIQSV